MPTFSKLVAGLCFAGLAWWATAMVRPDLPGAASSDLLAPVNAAIGLLLGWRMAGPRAGRGAAMAAGSGVTTGIATVMVALALWALVQMIRRSLRLHYDGPAEALLSSAALFLDYGTHLVRADLLAPLLAGSVLGGLAAEIVAGRRRA